MKFIIFLIALGLIILGYNETNEFTYLNGKLSSGFTATLYAVSTIVLIILFLNMFSVPVKKKVQNENIIPFKE